MSPTIVQNFSSAWNVPDGPASGNSPNQNLQIDVSNVTSGNWLVACFGWHGIGSLPAAVSVGDDAANFWQPIAISPANLSASPLNANPNFTSGLASWGTLGASATISTTVVYPGNTQSIKMVPLGGASTRCFIQGAQATITGSQYYTTSMWVYSPTGYATAVVFIGWTTGGVFQATTVSPTASILPGVWTQLTVSGQALASYNGAYCGLQLNNSPQPSDVFFVGQGTLTQGNGFSASTRCAIWAAPNSLSSVHRVSIVPLGSVTAMGGYVLEVSGMPSWLQTNASSTFLAKSSATVSVTANVTAGSFVVAVGANNNNNFSYKTDFSRATDLWLTPEFFIQAGNVVDHVGDLNVDITSQNTSSAITARYYGANPLNTNPTFTSTASWQAVNGSFGLSSRSSFLGTKMGVLTPNGTSATSTLQIIHSSSPSVTANLSYLGSAWVAGIGAAGTISFKIGIEWLTAGHATISTTFSPDTVITTGGNIAPYIIQAVAPATAAFASLHLTLDGTPPATKKLIAGIGAITQVTGAAVDSAAAIAAFQLSPSNVPVQPNASWPSLKLEAAFGQDAATTPDALVWTDISTRLFAFALDRGRQYELNALQAGNVNFTLRNDDGYLTPGSSLDPGLRVYTPIRLTALHSGRQYSLFQGYMERWPQTWVDPHYGFVTAVGVDSWTMFTATLSTIVRSTILQQRPTVYWPCADGSAYSSASNIGLTTNQTRLVETLSAFGAGSSTASFGDGTLKLAGDTNTNWICKGLTNTQGNNGTSLVYSGPPLPPLTFGVTIIFWFNMPDTGPVTAQNVYLFTMVGNNGPILALVMDAGTGLHIFTWNANTGVMTDHGSFGFGFSGATYMACITLTATSFNAIINTVSHSTGTETFATNWSYFTINGRNDRFTTGNFGNMAIAHVAIFPRILSPNEIDTDYFAGFNGLTPDFADQRVSRLISLLRWQPPQRIITDFTSADLVVGAIDIDGVDCASAITNIVNTEQALLYVDRMGYVVFHPRQDATLRPVMASLGENPGELPYRVTLELDFDPQYINNDVQVTHVGTIPPNQSTPNSTFIALKNTASINKYGDHSLQLNSYFNDVNQSTNLANYLLSQYSDPQLRVAQIELIPGANPAQFVALLALDIGDRVTLNRRPIGAPPISIQVLIIGIHHDVEWKSGKWVIRFDLMPASIAVLQTRTLTLDTAVLDVLDAGNVIGW